MRMSQKRVNELIDLKNVCNYTQFRLVKHQHLGNRANYYYTYSLVVDTYEGVYIETILKDTSLRNIYKFLLED